MRLFLKYLKVHFKITIEYKTSFILLAIAQGLVLFMELFIVDSLLRKFKLLQTYDLYEVILGFSAFWLGFSLVETFARGFDEFHKLIAKGGFDILLIRPRNIYLQILGSNIEYAKVSRVLGALYVFIFSLTKVITDFTALKLLLIIFMVIGAVSIILSLFIIRSAFAFKTVLGLEFFNVFTYGAKQVAEYPFEIFNRPFRLFFTFIIPVSLINYYPLRYLAGRTDNIWYVFIPLLAVIMIVISILIFNRAVRNYCSTGS